MDELEGSSPSLGPRGHISDEVRFEFSTVRFGKEPTGLRLIEPEIVRSDFCDLAGSSKTGQRNGWRPSAGEDDREALRSPKHKFAYDDSGVGGVVDNMEIVQE